jgi:hypothetical protein
MKASIPVLLLFILFSVLYSQDYRIAGKEFAWESSKPHKTQFSFHYPEMKNFKDNITSMNLFNRHIYNIVEAASDTFKVWIKDWETISTELSMGSYYEVGDSVFYKSNSLISIHFFEYSYFSGAAHPNNSSFSVNYDLAANKEVTLDDMLNSGWENTISELSIKSIMNQIYSGKTDPDDWVKEGAGPDKKNFKVYNVTQTGLVITFPTYQVASYAQGPVEVFIPYSDIKDIIKPNGPLAKL